MTVGNMIIGNFTNDMQDQMRFEDENGKWIDFHEKYVAITKVFINSKRY